MNKRIVGQVIIVVIVLLIVGGLITKNYGTNIINKSNEIVSLVEKKTTDFVNSIYIQFEEKDVLKKDLKLIKSDNTSLKEQNRQLVSENENTIVENDELKKQISSISEFEKKDPSYDYIPGEIIRRDGNDWLEKATINIGSKDNVTSGSAVLYQSTLLGYVDEVDENYSTIQLNTTGNVVVNIPSMVTSGEKNYNGQISRFDENQNSYKFESFHPEVKINLHDKVYTNGYAKGVPSKVLIGTIVDIDKDSDTNKTMYRVEPSENLYDARYVTVAESNDESN